MSISAGVHLVSSNHLQGLPVKKTTLPPYSRDLLLNNKCPLYFQPLARAPLSHTCKASSSKNNRRIPRLLKKKYHDPPPPTRGKFKNYQDQEDLLETSQMLSSENGGSRISDAPTPIKSGNTAEIIEVFRKHLPALQAKRSVNDFRYQSYGLNATVLNDEEKRNSIRELLKQLRTSGTNKKSLTNNVVAKGTINNLEDSDGENIDEDSDFEDDVSDMLDSDEDSDSDDEVPDMLDSKLKPVTNSRPPSRFSHQSPIPVAEHELLITSKTHEGEIQMLREEEKSGSEFLVYESESESMAEQSEGQHSKEKIEDLESLKVSELREIAKSRGLKGYSKLKKGELIEQLSLS